MPSGDEQHDQRELEALPGRIEALELEQANLQARMGDPAFYRQDGPLIAEARARLLQLEQELARAYARWEELEERGDRLPFEIGAFVALEACEGLLRESVKLEPDDVSKGLVRNSRPHPLEFQDLILCKVVEQ